MNGTNGSVNNAVLLTEIRDVRDKVMETNTSIARMEGADKEFKKAYSVRCAGVDRTHVDLDERVKLIERRWLPVLTTLRAKLIFIPTVILFILASLSHIIRIVSWMATKMVP